MIRKYSIVVALLAFLATLLKGVVGTEAPAEVISAALFWGFCFLFVGAAVGFGARRLIGEVTLPDPLAELESERAERDALPPWARELARLERKEKTTETQATTDKRGSAPSSKEPKKIKEPKEQAVAASH
ncbi:MAG: hypothetical protein ACKVX7_13890 [Planctomycetota bacterium]